MEEDKKMSKADLKNLIDERTKVNLAGYIDKLRADEKEEKTHEKEAEKLQNAGIVSDMSMVGGSVNLVKTIQGSIMDLSRKNSPWVKLSPEMENFTKAFMEYVRAQKSGRAMSEVYSKLLEEQTDPSGGYLVPEEFQATMVQYDTEPAIVWPRATVWPMGTDKLGMPKLAQRADDFSDNEYYTHFAGVDFTWTDEGGEKTSTEPSFEFIELIAHELSGYTAITDTLIEDSSINIMNFLTGLFRRAYVWETDRTFIRGNGARQPLGIVPDPAVLSTNRQAANQFNFRDAILMDSRLPSVFDQGAVWFMSKQIMNNLRDQRDNNDALILQEFYDNSMPGAGSKRITFLLGYPVVPSGGKTYPLGTTGDVILGNWDWYYIGDRKRFTMDVSRHYLFRNNKTAIRVCGRLDGMAAVPEAFVILNSTVGTS